MSLLQRLLLLPLLSPLLAVLLLGAVNPRPWVALRLLTWTSPALPLGAWISATAAAGAALSAAGTGLALRQAGQGPAERRQLRWRRAGREPEHEDAPPSPSSTGSAARPAGPSAWAGPSRGASEPPPTVAVPYRIVRKGRAPAAAASPARAAAGSAGGADDWTQQSLDEW